LALAFKIGGFHDLVTPPMLKIERTAAAQQKIAVLERSTHRILGGYYDEEI
jgi:hypothetical protein